MTTTDHKLNVQARKAIDWKWGVYDLVLFPEKVGEWPAHIRIHGPGDRDNDEWSPATSIKDAMELLKHLPPGWDYWITSAWVHLFGGVDDGANIKHETLDDLPRAITEAFVAAKKAEAGG